MKNDYLEKIKEEFIVDETKYDIESVPEQVKTLLNYVKVGTGGKVFLAREVLPDIRLKLILASRFLANKLQDEIKPHLSIEELAQYSGLDKDQVRARMSTIVKEKFARREGRGVFVVLPFQIKKFITELEGAG